MRDLRVITFSDKSGLEKMPNIDLVAAVVMNISVVKLKSKICTCQVFCALKIVWSVQGISVLRSFSALESSYFVKWINNCEDYLPCIALYVVFCSSLLISITVWHQQSLNSGT